jgi:hypothetical protein
MDRLVSMGIPGVRGSVADDGRRVPEDDGAVPTS